jgi:phosphoglycerate dehydrogenase-like enzyme
MPVIDLLVVDAANVVGSRPDGWWRDRPGAAARLVARLQAAARAGRLPARVVVVLEGHARAGVDAMDVGDAAPTGGVHVVHAPGEGDDTLAELAVAAAARGEKVVLVTADRGLAARVRDKGVVVVGPTWLLDRVDPGAAP